MINLKAVATITTSGELQILHIPSNKTYTLNLSIYE
jgi:hypothetical protein